MSVCDGPGALPHVLAKHGKPCVQVQCVVRFAYSVDAGGFVSCLAVKAFAQPLRVAQQPHQRVVTGLRGFLCPLCEVNKWWGHAHSPLGVGACFPYSLSQTDAPSLPPNYPRSSLLWASPTPQHHGLLSRSLDLSEGARSSAPMRGSPGLPLNRCVRLDTVCDPGGAYTACPFNFSPRPLLPAGVLKPSAPSKAVISGLQPSRSAFPLPLRLACFLAYASSNPLLDGLQG